MLARSLVLVTSTMLILSGLIAGAASAEPIVTPAFEQTWNRTDKLVADQLIHRTWMWGPQANTIDLKESYAESPAATRRVQYFDKSRMEITHPEGDQNSIWYVTNGLLDNELISGFIQTGDNRYMKRWPAQVNVAGDLDDPTGPTYATFSELRDDAALSVGTTITQRLARDGTISTDESLSSQGVRAGYYEPETMHTVATPFWDFMRSSGPVWVDGSATTALLFDNPFYATGYPIAEAFWANVKVGGTYRDVLLQCFQRRCLTYTPGNSEGWLVEAGNVGLHYYEWRYLAPLTDESITISPVTEWPMQNDPTINTYISGDAYHAQILQAPYGISRTTQYESESLDVSIQLEVLVVKSSSNSTACLQVGHDQNLTERPSYSICIDQDGLVSGGLLKDAHTLDQTEKWSVPPSTWMTFRIDFHGSTVAYYLNGRIIGTLNASMQHGAWVGFSVFSMGANQTAEYAFRGLKVAKLAQ